MSWFKKLLNAFNGKKNNNGPVKKTGPIQKEIELAIDEIVKSKLPTCLNLLNLKNDLIHWQSVFKAMAWAESSFKLTERYVETGLGKDRVTGKQNVSEGLLQMSYQDALFHSCEFDWSKDKSKSDLDESKTIFDMRKNIECGMIILDKMVLKKGHYIFNGGHYWAVLKPENKRHKVFLEKYNEYMRRA